MWDGMQRAYSKMKVEDSSASTQPKIFFKTWILMIMVILNFFLMFPEENFGGTIERGDVTSEKRKKVIKKSVTEIMRIWFYII